MYHKRSDPPERRTSDGFIQKFHCIAKRGTTVECDKDISVNNLSPISMFQTSVTFYIYFTSEYEAKYCDDIGMELLGSLKIDFSDRNPNRDLVFTLSFGRMELTATAMDQTNGKNYLATFLIDKEND